MLTLLFAQFAMGDVLVERDSTIYGRISQVNDKEVAIALGCVNSKVRTVPKARVKFFQFDSSCKPHKFVLPTSPLQLCEGRSPMYKVYFKDGQNSIYAREILLRKRVLLIALPNDDGFFSGPLREIDSIVPALVCPETIPEKQVPPKTFCHEPPVYAVNFSPQPVYNNKIFTRGFTVYVENIGGSTDIELPNKVARAVGTALSLWSTKLLRLRNNLDPKLAAFVDSSLGRSPSATLFVPPQVVRVECPENALIVVKVYHSDHSKIFPKKTVALAQTEGRTVLLNAVDFRYRWDLDVRSFVKEGLINLTTVMAHEIGHSFGFPDVSDDGSVMNARSIEDNLAGGPSDKDGLALTYLLKKMVTGTGPGEFNQARCAGLRLTKIP